MPKIKIYKRPIVATLHRYPEGRRRGSQVIWTRYYTDITNAIPRGVQLALQDGEPGDVIEFASSNHGYQIATVRLKVGSSIHNISVRISKELLEAAGE